MPGQRPALRGGRLVHADDAPRAAAGHGRHRRRDPQDPRPRPPSWRRRESGGPCDEAANVPAALALRSRSCGPAPRRRLPGRRRAGEDHAAARRSGCRATRPAPTPPRASSRTCGRRRSPCGTAEGHQVVLVTTDLIGLPRAISDEVAARVRARFGVERAAARPERLAHALRPGGAEEPRRPLRLRRGGPAPRRRLRRRARRSPGGGRGRGARRTSRPRGSRWGTAPSASPSTGASRRPRASKIGVNPNGPVDHDVPVLKVAAKDGSLRAVLFGYACHNTTLGGDFYRIGGDYAGYAQAEIEQAHPGATALFVMLCGGDQNPNPRGTLDLAPPARAGPGRRGRARAGHGPPPGAAPDPHRPRGASRSTSPPTRARSSSRRPTSAGQVPPAPRAADAGRLRRGPARARDAVPGAGHPARPRPHAPRARRRAGRRLRPAREAGARGREPDRGRLLQRRDVLHPLAPRPAGGRLRGGRQHDLLRPARALHGDGRGRRSSPRVRRVAAARRRRSRRRPRPRTGGRP